MNNLTVNVPSPTGSEDPAFVHSAEPLVVSRVDVEQDFPSSSSAEESDTPVRTSKAKQILSNWRLGVVILTPFLLLPILIAMPGNPIAKCSYMLLLMAIYWCTEALPLPATALMPLFVAPMLGLMKAKDVSVNYLKDLNFLFVGGLMFAVAVEKWNLHKRIALRVLLLVGTKPKMLLFGFISVTGFLSMWLSNTATAAMMIPIAHAVLVEMWKQKRERQTPPGEEFVALKGGSEEFDDGIEQVQVPDNHVEIKPKDMDDSFQNLGKAVSLAVCYGANIGGIGTLTGTGPNLIIGNVVKEYFPASNDLTFGSWMLFATPLTIICLAICWCVLVVIFLGPRALLCCKDDDKYSDDKGKSVLRREYRKLGPTSFPEIVLLVFFFVLVMLWLWRDPKFVDGWSVLFPKGYVTDATTGIFVCLFLFAFPSSIPCMKSHKTGFKLGPAILDWNSVHKKLPWGVIILLGGGFALANVCQTSGLSSWIGCQLGALESVPKAGLVFICGAVMTLFTEFTSNTSSASIFLPILAQLSVRLNIHPLYLLIPVTICSSFAFAFPVATPPNAIVFTFGYLKVMDMVKAGMLMNLFCLLALMLGINTWGDAYFNLQAMPTWANTTVINNC